LPKYRAFFRAEIDYFESAVRSVIASYYWTVDDVLKMYVDYVDFQGLLYWYEVLKEENKPKK
tara:strand:- start:24290 stop:24475 length:186 start_codon:yes stop_codon:yes gene_type:complete